MLGNSRWYDQVFSHFDPETGLTRHFAVGPILRDLQSGGLRPEVCDLEVTAKSAAYLLSNAGIEQDHLARITSRLHEPILLADFEDGTSLIIDGNHRYVLRFAMGLRYIKAYRLTPTMWEPYLIQGVPSDVSDALLPTPAP